MALTPHSCGGPVFGRLKPAECKRCFELSVGAPAVKGWGAEKKAQQDRFARAMRAHCCKASRCLPICTFGDW